MLGRGAMDAFVADFPELSLIEETSNAISQPLSEANLASFVAGAPRMPQGAMSLPTIDADSDVTASSFRIGPNHAFTAFGASEAAAHSRELHGFSPTMFEPFFRDIFSVKEETSQLNEQGAAPLLHVPDAETLVAGLSQSDLTQMFPHGMQSFDANLDSGLVFDLMTNTYADNTQASHSTQEPLLSAIPVPPTQPPPSPAPVPNQEVTHLSDLIYGPSEPPLYTQNDLEHVILSSPSADKAPTVPSKEESQRYRELIPIHSGLLIVTLIRSSHLLNRIFTPNPYYSYPYATLRAQTPYVTACNAGMWCLVCQDCRCAGVRREDP